MKEEILLKLPLWMQDIIKLDEEAKQSKLKPKDETNIERIVGESDENE